jgi:hypothetical protein
MSKRTQRAIARREFFGGRKPSKMSNMANSFGQPIGKTVCIRSMRRYYRVHHLHLRRAIGSNFGRLIRGYEKRDVYRDCSSKRVARDVRSQRRMFADHARYLETTMLRSAD